MDNFKKFGIFVGFIFLLVACGSEKPTFKDGIREGYSSGYSDGYKDGLEEIATKVSVYDSISVYCDDSILTTGIYIGKTAPDTTKICAGLTIIIPDSTTVLMFNGGYYNKFDRMLTEISN